jgi:hypothetical protein
MIFLNVALLLLTLRLSAFITNPKNLPKVTAQRSQEELNKALYAAVEKGDAVQVEKLVLLGANEIGQPNLVRRISQAVQFYSTINK